MLGPITTPTGPQLFLVESRYAGTFDERTPEALRIVRADAAPDLVAYTTRFSPADVALARDAGWRAAPEFGSREAVYQALFETPIGVLSDPFALDAKLALAVVDERRTAPPDARMLDRLTLDGLDAALASERAKATITRANDPLPELNPPTPSPAPSLPSVPPMPTPYLPTPVVPRVGLSTDQLTAH